MVSPLSIYIHFPFCKKKCGYCHFFSLLENESLKKRYFDALLTEIKLRESLIHSPLNSIVSIYFGGGTPSLMTPDEIEKILSLLPHSPDCEITLEANPKTLDLEKLKAFASCEINRISFGVQSFDDRLLQVLTREHSAKDAIIAIENALKAGFDNISIDLMTDIPLQTAESFEESLKIALSLNITHLSLYNLTFETKSAFYHQKKRLLPLLPNESESLAFIEKAKELLSKGGFERYEISAWARKIKYSKHNIGYWTRRNYLGFGPSSHSMLDDDRFYNVSNLASYFTMLQEKKLPIEAHDPLSFLAREKEHLALRLRLFFPFYLSDFATSIESQKTISRYIEEGFIELRDNKIHLTEKGANFYDLIAEDLIEC